MSWLFTYVRVCNTEKKFFINSLEYCVTPLDLSIKGVYNVDIAMPPSEWIQLDMPTSAYDLFTFFSKKSFDLHVLYVLTLFSCFFATKQGCLKDAILPSTLH